MTARKRKFYSPISISLSSESDEAESKLLDAKKTIKFLIENKTINSDSSCDSLRESSLDGFQNVIEFNKSFLSTFKRRQGQNVHNFAQKDSKEIQYKQGLKTFLQVNTEGRQSLSARFGLEAEKVQEILEELAQNKEKNHGEELIQKVAGLVKLAGTYLDLQKAKEKLSLIQQSEEKRIQLQEIDSRKNKNIKIIPGLQDQQDLKFITDVEKTQNISSMNKKTQETTESDQQSEQSFYRENMDEFSQEDQFRQAMKSGDDSFRDSGIRTASYVSDFSNKDYSSDDSVKSENEQKVEKENHNFKIKQFKKRQIREIAKLHARDIIAYKINKKLADQAALAAAQAQGASAGKEVNQRKQNLEDLVQDGNFDLSWTQNCERFRYKHKTAPTINPTKPDVVRQFRLQEIERYKHPMEPFVYKFQGREIPVGPTVRSRKQLQSVPRIYPLLKNDRPPTVTMHAVVRDAVARLPDFVGTRSDVTMLLRDSQYVVQDASEQMMISAVSGSLDRLSAELDPCARFNSHMKLWIYLHKMRSIEDPKWNLHIDNAMQASFDRSQAKARCNDFRTLSKVNDHFDNNFMQQQQFKGESQTYGTFSTDNTYGSVGSCTPYQNQQGAYNSNMKDEDFNSSQGEDGEGLNSAVCIRQI